jgi:diguanylate cyclase (GGDEF)-like protein
MENVKPSTRRSITFRMTMAVCAFVILSLSLLAILTLLYFKHELKSTISDQQNTLLTVISQDIDQKIGSAQKTIVAVSREVTPAIVHDPVAAQRFLDNRPGTKVVFDNGLYLFSRDGRIIVESPYLDGRRGKDISFREYYKKTIGTGKPVISAPFISTHTPGAPTVIFTAPVMDKDGTLIAILGGGLNLLQNNFLGELSHTRIARSGYLYLLASDRTMIMHPDKSRIMELAAPPGANKLLDRALAGFEGGEENVNSRGLNALTSFKHLQATDWIIAANYPLSEAYGPIYRGEKYLIAAVIICAFFTVLVVRFMLGRYTDALVRFARHVKGISSKSGAERLFRHESGDEIGLVVKIFNSMIQDHDAKSEELRHISCHDALSGLYNRAYFDEEIKRLTSSRITPVSVVMADIDDLKVCNDKYGHSVGDALIKATSQILLDSFRVEDAVARIGGDEFAVLLPGLDAVQAQIAIRRVRSLADKYESLVEGIPMSISLGYATVDNPTDLPAAIMAADQQMYLDKVSRKLANDTTDVTVSRETTEKHTVQGGSTSQWQRSTTTT